MVTGAMRLQAKHLRDLGAIGSPRGSVSWPTDVWTRPDTLPIPISLPRELPLAGMRLGEGKLRIINLGAAGSPTGSVPRPTDVWTRPSTLPIPAPLPCGLPLAGIRLGEGQLRNQTLPPGLAAGGEAQQTGPSAGWTPTAQWVTLGWECAKGAHPNRKAACQPGVGGSPTSWLAIVGLTTRHGEYTKL